MKITLNLCLLVVVSLSIGVSYFLPRTVEVDISHSVDANYLDVVEAYSDLPSFPEYTDGRAEKGVVTSLNEYQNDEGRKVVDMRYQVWGGGGKNPGRRIYTYYPDRKEVTIDLTFYTEAVKEQNNTRWLIKQHGDKTLVIIKGTRVTPWLYSLFSVRHNEYVVSVLNNIQLKLKGA
jgi:hypothetical protein